MKKFFASFFMLRSPRTAAMFALAYLAAVNLLVACTVWNILMEQQEGMSMARLLFKLVLHLKLSPLSTAALLITVCVLLSAYGLALWGIGLYGLLAETFEKKWLRGLLAGIGVLFVLPLPGLLLLPGLLKNKRYLPALAALAGSAAFAIAPFNLISPLSAIEAGLLLYCLAVSGTTDPEKFSWRFAVPLGAGAALCLLLVGCDLKLGHDVKIEQEKLARLAGRPAKIEEFKASLAQGLAPDTEPLKTLLAHTEGVNKLLRNEHDPAEAQALLAEIRRKHAPYTRALEEFLRLPVGKFAQKIPENDYMTGLPTPELSACRRAASFLCLKMNAFPRDKKNVAECSGGLIKLRDWLTEEPFLIGPMTRMVIESYRLEALGNAFAQGQLTRAEFAELLGPEPDWERVLFRGGADEALFFPGDIMLALESIWKERRDFLLPLFLRIPFLRDWRLVLRRVQGYCPNQAGRPAKMKKTPRNDYFFPALMIGDGLEVMFGAGARLRNRRRMVCLAVEVAEYRRKHGRLPESLAFLPKVPLSTLDKTPLMYAKTADGFRIFCRTDKGKIPEANDGRYSLSFRLAPLRADGLSIPAVWETLCEKPGCTGGKIFSRPEWRQFFARAKKDPALFEFLLSRFPSAKETKIHICNWGNASEGVLAVFAAERITGRSGLDYDGPDPGLRTAVREARNAVPKHTPLKKVLAAPTSCAELRNFFRKAYREKADARGGAMSVSLFIVDGLPERIAQYAPLWFFADNAVTGQNWLLYVKFLSTPADRRDGWHFLGWAAPRRKRLGPR